MPLVDLILWAFVAFVALLLLLRFVVNPALAWINRKGQAPTPRATLEARLARSRRALEIAERRESPQAERFRAQVAELEAQLEAA